VPTEAFQLLIDAPRLTARVAACAGKIVVSGLGASFVSARLTDDEQSHHLFHWVRLFGSPLIVAVMACASTAGKCSIGSSQCVHDYFRSVNRISNPHAIAASAMSRSLLSCVRSSPSRMKRRPTSSGEPGVGTICCFGTAGFRRLIVCGGFDGMIYFRCPKSRSVRNTYQPISAMCSANLAIAFARSIRAAPTIPETIQTIVLPSS